MLEEFVKSLGIEDAVIEKVKGAATSEDITPLAQEFLATQRTILLQDKSIEDAFKAKYGNMAVGKEKQLKKEAARTFGLTNTNEEIEGMSFSDILKAAKDAKGAGDSTELEALKGKYNTLLDAIDTQKSEYEQKLSETLQTVERERRRAKVLSDFEQYLVSVVNINAKNIKTTSVALLATIKGLYGADVDIDDKNALQLYKDGNLLVADNKKVNIKDVVTSIYSDMMGEGFSRRNERTPLDTPKDFTGKQKSIAERNRLALEASGLA